MERVEEVCFASLITTDSYFPGIQVVVKSIRQFHPTVPIEILIEDSVSVATQKRIKALGVLAILVPAIDAPFSWDNSESSVTPCWAKSQYTKLHIWQLTKYRRVVYIDADCLVCQPLDELLALQTDFAACPDIFPPDRFNAGVLVIQPSEETFQRLLRLSSSTHSYDGGDTGFLNAVFNDWFVSDRSHRLPVAYNAQRTMYWFTRKRPGYWQAIEPIRILHYSSSPKPWEGRPSSVMDTLDQQWWAVLLGYNPLNP
eukprot:gene6912-7639_t